MPPTVERKLAAILSADVVGYSRLMADDEENGMDAEALDAAIRANTGAEANLRRGYEEGGWNGLARALLDWNVSQSGKPCTHDRILGPYLLAWAGEDDDMFMCLAQAVAHQLFPALKADPTFAPYRDDPRFTALLRRMNLAE